MWIVQPALALTAFPARNNKFWFFQTVFTGTNEMLHFDQHHVNTADYLHLRAAVHEGEGRAWSMAEEKNTYCPL